MNEVAWQSRVLPLAQSSMISLNSRMHHMKRAGLAKQLRRWGYLLGREGKGVARLHLTRARVVCEIAYPDRRRRDLHNLMGTIKPMVDGLIDAGLLPDDSDKFMDGPHLVCVERLAAQRMNVRMYEVQFFVYADERRMNVMATPEEEDRA